MEKLLQTLAIGLVAFCFVATAPAQSTLNINLSDNGGNTKFSLNWTGDIVNGGAAAGNLFPILWHSFGGEFTNYVNNDVGSYILTGFGSMQNLTTGTNLSIGSVDFTTSANSDLFFYFSSSKSLTIHQGDIVRYIPGQDSTTIGVPFSLL